MTLSFKSSCVIREVPSLSPETGDWGSLEGEGSFAREVMFELVSEEAEFSLGVSSFQNKNTGKEVEAWKGDLLASVSPGSSQWSGEPCGGPTPIAGEECWGLAGEQVLPLP